MKKFISLSFISLLILLYTKIKAGDPFSGNNFFYLMKIFSDTYYKDFDEYYFRRNFIPHLQIGSKLYSMILCFFFCFFFVPDKCKVQTVHNESSYNHSVVKMRIWLYFRYDHNSKEKKNSKKKSFIYYKPFFTFQYLN